MGLYVVMLGDPDDCQNCGGAICGNAAREMVEALASALTIDGEPPVIETTTIVIPSTALMPLIGDIYRVN